MTNNNVPNDALGNFIEAGDVIAYPSHAFSHLKIKTAKVLKASIFSLKCTRFPVVTTNGRPTVFTIKRIKRCLNLTKYTDSKL